MNSQGGQDLHVQRGDNNCKHQSIILLKANAKRILCTDVSKGQMGFLKLTARTMCMPIGLAYFLNLLCKCTILVHKEKLSKSFKCFE